MTSARLTVGLVGPLPPPAGGMANQTRQLADLLTEEGIGIRLVRTNAPYRPRWVSRIKGVRAVTRLAGYVRALWRTAGTVDVLHIMANSGWNWHLVAAPAVWIGSWRGVPVVVNYRGGGADGFLNRSVRVVRPTLARAQTLAVPSGFLEDVFKRHGFDAVIVPNIVNLERFKRRDPEALFRTGLHVVVTRNLEPVYDVETALRAFALVRKAHPQARMSIAGTGSSHARLRNLAQELDLREAVVFTGGLDNARIAELLASADVVLNPSRVDNMPISLLEALAAGVCVVSTSVGGVPYLVEHERTALLVPPGEPEPMAQAILRLYDDRALAHGLAEEGWAHVQQFAWPSVRMRLMDVYRAVIDARCPGRPRHEGAH